MDLIYVTRRNFSFNASCNSKQDLARCVLLMAVMGNLGSPICLAFPQSFDMGDKKRLPHFSPSGLVFLLDTFSVEILDPNCSQPQGLHCTVLFFVCLLFF